MVDPQVIIKANYNRTLLTIRVSAINSSDWVDIVSTKIELFRDSSFSNRFYQNTTTHYKVRAYLKNEAPDRTIYGKITLTKDDNTTHESTFSFVVPFPVLGTVKNADGTKYITSMRKMDKNGNLSPRNYTNKAISDVPPHIDIMADEAGEMIVGNQWYTPILVQNITQGTTQVEIARGGTTTIAVNLGDTVRVIEKNANSTFKRFDSNVNPLCKGVSAHITVMPAMNKFAQMNAQPPVDSYFFYSFNDTGTLTSLPEGSFDLHEFSNNVEPYGFFYNFNKNGALTSLPEGSFDTSNIKRLSGSAFYAFNSYGALTSLPEGSFDFENLITQCSFQDFNYNGALQSLPEGSFGFSSLDTLRSWAFSNFNRNGRIASLPAGSFHFKKGSMAGGVQCFGSFNLSGSLVSFPEYALNFTIADVTNSGSLGFNAFNQKGALTSLPAGSFHFDPSLTYLDNITSFNSQGALTSLPEGSFNFDNVTTLGFWTLDGFNKLGALTSLPEDSFNFDNVTTISGQNIFNEFNHGGALKTLPKGSFSLKNLTTLSGNYTNGLAASFNAEGALEYLPIGAFSIDGLPSNYQGFGSFNGNADTNTAGKLAKSDTDYNSRFINLRTTAQDFSYYDPSTQTSFKEAVSSGNPVKYYQADYFSVSYTESPAYTTDLADSYLSGQTITFSAIATDPEYLATPTITTAGGITVTVIDNGDDTYTFVMPQDDITVNITVARRPAVIMLTAEEAGTMVVVNKWTTSVLVKNITQGTPAVTVSGGASTNVAVAADDEIKITEGSANVTFRNWINIQTGICRGVLARVSSMPDMNRFTTSIDGTSVGQYFFQGFCAGDNGKGVTSLPAGSFDTSGITNINSAFFSRFNYRGLLTSLPSGSFHFNTINNPSSSGYFFFNFNCDGALTSLPVGSFNIDSFTSTGNYFFSGFNMRGALTSLPVGSFNTSNITTIGTSFFENFNTAGALTSLPDGSFDTSNITQLAWNMFGSFNRQGALISLPVGSFDISGATSVYGSNIFYYFNSYGALTSLPAGSFHFNSAITNLSSNGTFFQFFNEEGALTSLPAGSFNLDNLTKVESTFFHGFNARGALTSLPAGSFNTSNITSVKDNFFQAFNSGGALASLPTGSFNISNISSVGNYFFTEFNRGGLLTSLPDGSFIFNSNLTTTPNYFFQSFNNSGKLTSLPAGSFDTSNITSVGSNFFGSFNQSGDITSLPTGSFDTSNITSAGSSFFDSFNRTGKLTSLPNGSFDISGISGAAPNSFFATFNYQGGLLSFPAGSFNTSNITSVGNNFFSGFTGDTNSRGTTVLILPAGSFDTSNITSAGSNFCVDFNFMGRVESLPAGSFNTSNLTKVGDNFLGEFNYQGHLTSLPTGSFGTSNITSVGNNFLGNGGNFNKYGNLPKETTAGGYNPNFINPTSSSITVNYAPNSTGTIVPGAPFYFKTA